MRNQNPKLVPATRVYPSSLRGSHPPVEPVYHHTGFTIFGWKPKTGWKGWFWTYGAKSAGKQFAEGYDPRTPEGQIAILSAFADDPQVPAINAESKVLSAESHFGTGPNVTPYTRLAKATKVKDTREALRATADISKRVSGAGPTNVSLVAVQHPIKKRGHR